MNYSLGIDIGTGSTKAIAVSPSGEVIYATHATYPTHHPEPEYCEQAPELIWQAFVKCIRRAVEGLKENPQVIVLSSAMHGVIPIDNKGNALMNMITWADNRSAAVADRIKASSSGEEIYTATGTPLHAMSPLSKILWLKENRSDIFSKSFKYIAIKEFVWFKLFGYFEVDYSIASATGLFDLKTLRWHAGALSLCGIRSDQLSQPTPTDHLRQGLTPSLSDNLKLKADTPFLIGSSDGCMANIGSFAIEPGVAALTIGTSGAIRVGNPTPTFNFKAMTFTYCLFENLFICGGPINNGGIALKWYAQHVLKAPLQTPEDYDALLDPIRHVRAGADGVLFLPYLLGERAPIWNSHASALFMGLRNHHTQAHLTRAVVEGISMALYHILKSMEDSGLAVNKVHVSGGFVHSRTWLQILSDIFNKEIHLIHEEDASAIGAAYLGLKWKGLIVDYHQLKPRIETSFMPDPSNHARYQKLFPIYERIYEKLREEMKLLQQLQE